MNLVIIGRFSADTAARIRAFFPPDWKVALTGPDDLCLQDAEALIPEHLPVSAALLDRAPKLRMIQTGAGSDNVDLAECTRRGILVCSAAGVNAAAVAEHTMALILGWFKNIVYLDTFLKARRDSRELCYSGGELLGKAAGIIGLGAIGQRVAALCQAFGMNVLGYSRHPKCIQGVENVRLEELLERSDVVSLHVPATPETRHLMDRQAFRRMKPSAVLVNTARGSVVHEADLIEALRRHQIAGACLDVYEEEPLPQASQLRSLPNVLLTPHTAGYPDGVRLHAGRYSFFAGNLQRAWRGELPENLLNQDAWKSWSPVPSADG
ncbi:NAD(P)-dependent oxidoreductase [uncultured Oscillibacter sp.]|uniref:NAD(P)-dependent oxidoreductase n=1 Tax=uncultured Oscillibacter sp. TaxID=876091 RepID=UPI00280554BE|nr:NAD(P)-dependent oxidoreductase [uncultured Oscillibacter sp.]